MSQTKFCATCGNALGANEKFCGKCGTPVPADQPAVNAAPVQEAAQIPQPVEQPAPQPTEYSYGIPADIPAAQTDPNSGAAAAKLKPKVNPVILVAAAAAIVVIVLVVVIVTNLTKYQKIDAQELFKVTFSGLDGKGTATALINFDIRSYAEEDEKFYEIYDDNYYAWKALYNTSSDDEDSKKKKDEFSDYFSTNKKDLLKAYSKAKNKKEAEAMRDALLKTRKGEFELKLELSDDKDLKNGDTITCTVEYDEEDLKEAGIKLTNTEFEIKVEGLTEAVELDLFESFEVKFSGIDGRGSADYSFDSEKYPFMEYYFSGNYDLSNGDSITATGYVDTYMVDDFGYVDEETYEGGVYFTYNGVTYAAASTSQDKEFVVSGLTEPEEIDIFEGVTLEFEGIDPFIFVTDLNDDNCPEAVQDCVWFYVDSYTPCHVGGTITVRADVSLSSLESYGYKPKGTLVDGYYEKEFEVTGDFGSYYTADTDPAEYSKLDDIFNEKLEDIKNSQTGSSYSSSAYELGDAVLKFGDFQLDNTYVCYDEDPATLNYEPYSKNYVYRLYHTTVVLDNESKSTKTLYIMISLGNVYVTADGDVEVKGYDDVYYSTDKNALISDMKDYHSIVNEVAAASVEKPDSGSSDNDSSAAADEPSEAEAEDAAAEPAGDDSSADDSSEAADDSSAAEEEIVP